MRKEPVIPFHHPFLMTLCGPSQSGKTYKILQIIQHADVMITPCITKLLYLFTAYQDMYDKIKQIIDKGKQNGSKLTSYEFIDCSKSIPSFEKIKPKLGERTLLVLDDLMITSVSNKENTENLDNIASRDSHHTNTSVIFVCQNLNYGNGKLRNVRVNSQYHLMLKNLADLRNIEMVASNKKIPHAVINEINNDVANMKYGYVLFDASQKSYANAKLRTGIFPGDDTIIYNII